MKKIILLMVGIVVIAGLIAMLVHRTYQTAAQATLQGTQSASTKIIQTTANPSTNPTALPQSTLGLILPITFSQLTFPPKSFGIYPFGIISSEHPEGHAGFNFEVSQSVQIIAPADIIITKLVSPSGRSDEHTIIARLTDGHQLEFLRVGQLAANIVVGTALKQGEALAWPAHNNSLNIDMFHMGILDAADNAICPEKLFWQAIAWDQLNKMLTSSRDGHGKAYAQLCYTTQPIPRSKRLSE